MNWLQEHQKTAWFSGIAIVVILLGGGITYFVRAHEQHKEQEKQSKQESGPVRVRIVHPKQGGVERLVKRPGTVHSFEHADLYAKVSGYLRMQEVDIGSHVEEHQVLAEVYAPEKYKDVEKAGADVRKAKAGLQASEAYLKKSQADQIAAESRYEQSKSDVKKAQALVSLRKKQYDRYRELAKKNAVQQELVDEKLEAQLSAEAAETAAEKGVSTALSEVGAAKAAVVQAQADVEDAKASVGVAEAALDRAEVFAKYTQIVSPYTGVVTKRTFHNGDFIRDAAGGGSMPQPVLAVARIDKMHIVIQTPDIDIPFLKVGDTVTLTISTLRDEKPLNREERENNGVLEFTGKVARMAYSESFETRTMRTEVDLENPVDKDHPNGILTNGMYGLVIIQLGREKGLRVPSSCLFGNEKGDRRSVYVVRDGKAHEMKVKIGIDDGIEATIREGLSTSDQVVVERPPGLADKMSVEILHDQKENAKLDKEEKKKETDTSETPKNNEKKTKGKGKKK